jgi:L-threonylcarbamoyladenylate synthase
MALQIEYIAVHPRTRLLALSTLSRLVAALRTDGLAVLPTETGYMLAAVATSEAAVARAFRVKGRSQVNVMHVACSSLEMVSRVAEVTAAGAALLGELTPGPVSVVMRKRDTLPDGMVTLNGTVGIRVPDHPATLQVIAATGHPLTATSLNAAGQGPISIDPVTLEQLDWPDSTPVLVVEDAAATAYSQPSTLVRITSGSLEVLRQGPVTLEMMNDAIARTEIESALR